MAKQSNARRKGRQGWRQFIVNKEQMLDAFDRARTKSQGRPVQTEHGKVAEAEFRKWLESFLPKKYGVASGLQSSASIVAF